MESLKLIDSKKDLFFYFSVFLVIFLLNIVYEYFKYQDLVSEEIFESESQILNIYEKDELQVLKLQSSDFIFFTSIDKKYSFKKLDSINIAIITTKIDFLSFLKGFYAKSVYYDVLENKATIKNRLYEKILKAHSNIKIQELFSALFLAIPISKENRQVYTDLGISHLIAISGFHLAILTFILYWIIYFPYSFFHKRYFIYRNRKYDITLITIFFLFLYLQLTNIVPSLLRSFIMLCLGIYFLRRNYELISFQTLFFTLLFIIALFPKYIFSISLWFSIIGVFYIFLYIQYFKKLPKLFNFLFFNFWIFFVFNPIVHFFFSNTSYEQLLSPFITLFFTIFYPIELLLHLFNYANLLDDFILVLLNYNIYVYSFETPLYFFIIYILCSICSIFSKKYFIVLNILLMIFNIKLYIF